MLKYRKQAMVSGFDEPLGMKVDDVH